MKALVRQKCGPDVNQEWPDQKCKERLEEIRKKAAAAAGPLRTESPPPLPRGGPAADDARTGGLAQDAGMTLRQYDIAWERAEKYCLLLEAGLIHPLQPVVYPGDGDDIFWIYSEAEARVIEPLCPEILKLRDSRNVLWVHIYWYYNPEERGKGKHFEGGVAA